MRKAYDRPTSKKFQFVKQKPTQNMAQRFQIQQKNMELQTFSFNLGS